MAAPSYAQRFAAAIEAPGDKRSLTTVQLEHNWQIPPFPETTGLTQLSYTSLYAIVRCREANLIGPLRYFIQAADNDGHLGQLRRGIQRIAILDCRCEAARPAKLY